LLLPEHLASAVAPYLVASPDDGPAGTRTIPYSLLLGISKWTRSEDGKHALEENNPPLSPASYSMIALLAGTRTSPDRLFPPPPKHEPTRELNDRRAVTAIMNALLSIIGAGAAAWFAAQSVGWRDEWVCIFDITISCSFGEYSSSESTSCSRGVDGCCFIRSRALSHLGIEYDYEVK
jgi:hypothetical protein